MSDIVGSVTYSPDRYLHKFTERLLGHVADLAHALKSIADGSFQELAAQPAVHELGRLQHPGVDVSARAHQRQLAKCLRAMVGDFIFYLDELAAHKKLRADGIPIVEQLVGEAAIISYVENHIQAAIRARAQDRRIKAPAKIDLFAIPDVSKAAAKEFVTLRNCLEHHDGIPSRNIAITVSEIQFTTTTGRVVNPPCVLEAGEGLQVGMNRAVMTFPANQELELSEPMVRKMAFTLEMISKEVFEAEAAEGHAQATAT
jgi:hypothetical protein